MLLHVPKAYAQYAFWASLLALLGSDQTPFRTRTLTVLWPSQQENPGNRMDLGGGPGELRFCSHTTGRTLPIAGFVGFFDLKRLHQRHHHRRLVGLVITWLLQCQRGAICSAGFTLNIHRFQRLIHRIGVMATGDTPVVEKKREDDDHKHVPRILDEV